MNGEAARVPTTLTPTAECGDVLDAFLQDMEALDHQLKCTADEQSRPSLQPTSSNEHRVSARKRLNPSWLKRKRELQSLREQTQELQDQIALLQATEPPTEPPTEPSSGKKWKATLEVEQQRCQASQDKNDRLKNKLQLYANASGAIQAVLSDAQHQYKELLPKIVVAASTLRTEMGAGRQLLLASPSVFDMLEARVNARFGELKLAIDESHRLMAKTDTEHVNISYEGDSRVRSVSFSRAKLLPFEEGAVSSVIWSIVQLGRFPDGEDSRVIKRSQDVFAMDTMLTVYLDCGTIRRNSHSVIKRFMTPQGLVFLMESCSYWTAADLCGSGSWSHSTDERGCFSLLKYSLGESGRSCDVSPGICELRSELTLLPNESSHKATSCIKSRWTVNEIVIPSFREVIKSRQQFVENALFDNIRSTCS